MLNFRAKFVIKQIARVLNGRVLHLSAASGPGNEAWSAATPNGDLQLHVTNTALFPDVDQSANVGDFLYLDLSPAPILDPLPDPNERTRA